MTAFIFGRGSERICNNDADRGRPCGKQMVEKHGIYLCPHCDRPLCTVTRCPDHTGKRRDLATWQQTP